MSKYLLRIEGVNFNSFVTDTQDLSTIRGGGLLLLRAAAGIAEGLQREVPNILRLKEVTSGASIGLYDVEIDGESGGQALRDGASRWLKKQKELRHATIVLDVEPAGDASEFPEVVQSLIARNHWQQMQSFSVALDSTTSDNVCEVDKVRPAATEDWIHGKDRWVSQSVFDRRRYGRDQKQAFYGNEADRSVSAGFAQDLDELSSDPSKGNLHRKIAIIHLDGNGFGKIKTTAGNSLDVWSSFDQTVKTCRRRMLAGLLDAMSGDDDWKTAEGKYRMETLLWGGDEIVWVVPAWKGFETLNHFYRSSESWSFQGKPLRHAGGIIFCHHNAPIHRLARLVQELADQAKGNGGGEHNRIAYEVLESFDHVGSDFEGYRKSRAVQPLEPGEEINLQHLILEAGRLPLLQRLVNELQEKLSRRKLHDVAEELLSRRRKQRQNVMNDFTTRLLKAGVLPATIQELETQFNGEACWLHLNSLWDYIV
jgi:hypothetical protein